MGTLANGKDPDEMLHYLHCFLRQNRYSEKVILHILEILSETPQYICTMDHPDLTVFRDDLMAFWLSPKESTRDPIISMRALAGGLTMVEA